MDQKDVPQRPRVKPTSITALRRFFEVLVARCFQELWIWDRDVSEYVVDLLVKFVRTEAIYRIGEIQRKPLETIAELLMEVSLRQGAGPGWGEVERLRTLRQHTGDYTLFMSGMFRAFLERHRILDLYLIQGASAYRETASLDRQLYRSGARRFEILATDFERVSGALDYMRKVYLTPAARPSAFQDILERFDRWC